MEEKIMTLHPEGKNGVRISLQKYEQVKAALLTVLGETGETTFQEVTALATDILNEQHFDGKPIWYIVAVKQDLEARGLINKIPKKSPQRLKLP